MKRIAPAAAFLVGFLPALAAAQIPPSMQPNTVIGRGAVPAAGGPPQSIPFAQLFANAGIPAGPVTCSSHNWFSSILANGTLVCTQPSFADLTSTIAASQLIPPTASTLGGVQSKDCTSGGQFVQKINTDGTETCATPAGGGTVTQVNSGTGLTGGPVTTTGTLAVSLTSITNSLSGNVAITTSSYASGPTVAQGASGVWDAHGTATLSDSTAASQFYCKLWDGTNVIASGGGASAAAAVAVSISLSGTSVSSPPGNIRIDCTDTTAGNHGLILFNSSGNSKDSTVTAVRIQ